MGAPLFAQYYYYRGYGPASLHIRLPTEAFDFLS